MKEYTKNRASQSRTVESNSKGFRQPPVSEILQAYRNGTLGRSPVQRESIEEEDDLTSGQPPVSAILQQYSEKRQRYASEEDEEMLQGKFDSAQRQEKTNNTGLPDNLKSGIENLSGYSMDDVKVHYNSDKPTQLNALAYTQGTDIHVAPGQEKHLPHEAWHVVQQKQGRVQPTMQIQGVNVNDNEGLEKEADTVGSFSSRAIQTKLINNQRYIGLSVIQGIWVTVTSSGKRLNLINNGDNTYTDSKTGETYKLDSIRDGATYVSLIATAPPPSMVELGSWTKDSSGIRPVTPFGPVSATHKRGAPKISSRAADYGKFPMGDTYEEYVRALRSGGKKDNVIAQALLDQDASVLSGDGEQRGAAMLYSTVYLAEEWRKHGAAKICRGELRLIAAGKATFDDILTHFEFVQSADDGRKQVARFHEVQFGQMDESDLSETDREIFDALSPLRDDDFSSDDDERERKSDAVKKNRIFYKK